MLLAADFYSVQNNKSVSAKYFFYSLRTKKTFFFKKNLEHKIKKKQKQVNKTLSKIFLQVYKKTMNTTINTYSSNVESSQMVIEARPLSPFKTDEQRLNEFDTEGYYDNLFLDSEDISPICLTLSKTSSMSSPALEINEEGKLSHETLGTAQDPLFHSGEVINFDNFCDYNLLSLDSDEISDTLMFDSISSSNVESIASSELPMVPPQKLDMDVNNFKATTDQLLRGMNPGENTVTFDEFCDYNLLFSDSGGNSLMNLSSSSSTVESIASNELPMVPPQKLDMDVNVFETNKERAQSEVIRYMFYATKLRTADTAGIEKIIDIETKLLINIIAGILWQNGLEDDANQVSACDSLFSPAFQQWLPSKQFIVGQPPAFMWNTCNFGCEDFVYLEQYVSKYGLYGNSFIGYCGSAIDRKLKQLEFQICPPVSFFSKTFDNDLKETIVIIRGEKSVKPAKVSAKRMRDYDNDGPNKRARHCSECLKVCVGLNDSSYGSFDMSVKLCRDCYNKTLI